MFKCGRSYSVVSYHYSFARFCCARVFPLTYYVGVPGKTWIVARGVFWLKRGRG